MSDLELKRKRALAKARAARMRTPESQEDAESPVFPSAVQIEGKGVGQVLARAGLGALDLLDLPKRALANITGQGELSDPEANIWAKPRQIYRDYLEKRSKEGPEEVTQRIGLPLQYGGVQESTVPREQDLEFSKQMGDALFEVVGDPYDYGLEDATHPLSKTDVKRAQDALRNDPFFASQPRWIEAIERLLSMGVRAEQQALAKWGLNYVLDDYLPSKLAAPASFLP